MQSEIKFRYVFKHFKTGDVRTKIITIHDMEQNQWGEIPEWEEDDGYQIESRDPYTGLKDRNGKEIYEGDIIRITFDTNYYEKPYYIGVVNYRVEDDYPAFDLNPWIDCGMNALSWLKSESDESVRSYEVIGNRWDNSDLLEDQAGDLK